MFLMKTLKTLAIKCLKKIEMAFDQSFELEKRIQDQKLKLYQNYHPSLI